MKKTKKDEKTRNRLVADVSSHTIKRLKELAVKLNTKPNKAVELAILFTLDAQEKPMSTEEHFKKITTLLEILLAKIE